VRRARDHFAERRAACTHRSSRSVTWCAVDRVAHDWRPSSWTSARSNARALCADRSRRSESRRCGPWSSARRSSGGVTTVRRFPLSRDGSGSSICAWLGGRRVIARRETRLRGCAGHRDPGRGCTCRSTTSVCSSTRRSAPGEGAGVGDGSMRTSQELHRAEQLRLLVRLAADSGARRGELAALRFSDSTTGFSRSSAALSQAAPTKTGVRRLTLGSSTAMLCASARRPGVRACRTPCHSDLAVLRHQDTKERLTAGAMSHWLRALPRAGLPVSVSIDPATLATSRRAR